MAPCAVFLGDDADEARICSDAAFGPCQVRAFADNERRIIVGRNRLSAVPKEQPPRKLSGKRTSEDDGTLERSHLSQGRLAEGITISGDKDRGGS